MEEGVGRLWHHLVSRLAANDHPEAAVTLEEMRKILGMLFRTLGGERHLELAAAVPERHGARRRWLPRLAGSDRRIALSSLEAGGLFLPERLSLFPERELNRGLYLWLAAFHACEGGSGVPLAWLPRCREVTRRAVMEFPGMASLFATLVAAHLRQRPLPEALPRDEARREELLRRVLRELGQLATDSSGACGDSGLAVNSREAGDDPDAVTSLPKARGNPFPVPLWPAPWAGERALELASRIAASDDPGEQTRSTRGKRQLPMRRQAERVAMPREDGAVLPGRFESILSWADFVPVDRPHEEEDEAKDAAALAADLDRLSVARDSKPVAARLRFDLDLPGAAVDDLPVGDGILLPEWDWKRGVLRADRCRLVSMLPREAPPRPLPPHLERPARRLRHQFEGFRPERHWLRRRTDGPEVDLDAWIAFQSQRLRGDWESDPRLYRGLVPGLRDLSCLLLADLSLSTSAWVGNERQVIEVIRETLLLFAEALAAVGDRLALYGFSSRRRDHVRFHLLKGFAERYDDTVRGRILALKPGYYTRMGAGVRQATRLLAAEKASRRLLLLLTDGKPHDLDGYEGRFGNEDTRMSLIEARRAGIIPFVITIDDEATAYADHLFGAGAHAVIHRPEELAARLPLLYARLTEGG
ncbi:MAG: nitric oxide reductase [Magnetococcales bacterium]|nr:nitric oxide reductase [Magnetococcales bacterium]MBF0155748.1 nitric oxide reductase [Magnetococcales bacterium]